ncbi:MAG: nucleotidyltransferase family protein [Longimicrobiaceae bacterium]
MSAAVAHPPSPAHRTAELTLLLACARLTLSPDEAARVRQTASTVDWSAMLALARRHRLIPFLHRHLKDAPLPRAAARELLALQREEVNRALRMASVLRRRLDALAAAGVEALAYKGPALAMQAYGELGMRSFVDLDLLVRPDDVPAAIAALWVEGYLPGLALSPAQERWFRRMDGDYPLVHRGTRLLLELHARVSSERFCMPISTDALIGRSATVPLGGGRVRTLGDDDLLLVLAVHGAKHRWKRLEWVAALAELLRAGRGDVGAALRLASGVHARRTLLLGLALARRLLDAPLAEEVVREIEDDAGLAALAAEAEGRMFGEEAQDGEDTAANLRFNLRARDGAVDRARYAARWLFAPTPEDWRWAHLPDALFPLYRVLRPVRLLLRHGRGGGR